MTSSRDSQRRSGSFLSRAFSRHDQDEDPERRETLAVVEALELARGRGLLPSPTELCIDLTRTCKTLTPLRWHHWDHAPHKMRLTNTGCTVMVSAKWRSKVRAHLTGGPLLGRYVFSQLHFHWGQEDDEGSEHTLEGESFPLEMHMVLFKSRYLTQEAALKEMDGVVEVAYFFQLAKKDNPLLESLVQSMSRVKCAMKSTRLGPMPLSQLIPSFPTDYLLYMGSLLTGKCAHALTWIVQYQPLTISKRQLKALRSVHGLDGSPLLRNWRKAHPPLGRTVLHVLPPHSKITHQGDHLSEVPRESRRSTFSPDWTENEPPPEESPKKGRRFFGCFGKKNQDAAEETAIVGSSGDGESTDTSGSQLRLPRIASQKPFCHPKVSETMFRAMCEASHLLSMSSSSQHSSTAGEDAHDCRPETAAGGYTERGPDVTDDEKRRPLDMGFILHEPPELRRTVGAAFFNPSDRRRSFGVTFLDHKDHRRAFMRPFNPLLSEVEEESDRTSEAVGDSAGNDSGDRVTASEECGLLPRRLPPLKSPPSVVKQKDELSTVNEEDLDAGGIGDARLSLELSTCSLNVPVSPADSLTFELTSPTGQDSETSLLTILNEESPGSEESDGIKLSPNDERDTSGPSGACNLTGSVLCIEDSLPATYTLLRYCKRGISWWVPLDFTSDDNGNDAEGSTRDVAQPYPVDKLSLSAASNCFLGEEVFTDTSTTTDTQRTAITACRRCTDLLSDSNQSTEQHSSEEQEALASIWRPEIPGPGFKDIKNDSLGISGDKKTLSVNANASPTSETASCNLYPDVTTIFSIYPEETCHTNGSDVSYTCSTRTRAQKRFDEEELRFPEVKVPKRNNHKSKPQKKKTSLSMSSLQEMQKNSTSHSVYQRATKDGKAKERINSWREMQSRKRSSRKSENKKHNRSKRRHHSSSSMDHLLHGSSSEDRSNVEKKVSKTFKWPATAKTSDTVFAAGKSTKVRHEYLRLERSNSSSSVSSIYSSTGAKCIDKVVNSGGIHELIGSGDEMQLQEISFHYVPYRAAAAPLNRKRLITAADHGDGAIGKSPSTLRFHLKAPADMNQIFTKAPSGSYITIDGPVAYVQEREITVGMVLVDTLRSEEGTETNPSSAQEIPSVDEPQIYPEKSEDTPVENSRNLSTSAPVGDCGTHECVPASQLKSVVDNAGINHMEISEATTSHPSTVECNSPRRKRCCNAECWICQLSTIKVIQHTQSLENSKNLPTSENSERAIEDTTDTVKPAGNEDEIAAVVNVSSNAVQRFSSVFSKTLGIVQCSDSNEPVPLPEPGPVGDVPLQQSRTVGEALPTTQNEITELKSGETPSADSKVYRTTMELRLFSDGTILGGYANSNSSAALRTTESSETSKEILPERQNVPQMAVRIANSSSSEETNSIVQLLTANNENRGANTAGASTEIIDIYRKIKRGPQKKNKLTVEGIPKTIITDGLSSYTSCATESDVSLIPDEDEAVRQSPHTQSFPSGEEMRTSQNQGVKCAGMDEYDKSNLKKFKLEYEILSKVLLYATLRQLGITPMSVTSAAGAHPSRGNETCGSNELEHKGDAIQPSLGTEVVRSLSKVPNSQIEDTNTKSTWTGPDDVDTTAPEDSVSQQALPVIPEAESQRETVDTEERKPSVPDGDGGVGETNCSNTQVLTATSKTETLCTSASFVVCAKNDRLSNIAEENMGNDTEVESIADSQETRDLDITSISNASNATRRQPKNKTASVKTASIAGSVKRPKLCSVEVRQKAIRPGSEPKNSINPMISQLQKYYRPWSEQQQSRRPKIRPSRDRILSPREVYERRKMYAKNLALRRAQKANHQAGSEDDTQSEGKSVGEPPQKEYRSNYMKFVGDYQSPGSVKLGEAGSRSVSASKETSVKGYRTDTKSIAGSRMSENVKPGKDASSCSTGSTKSNSIFSGARERAVMGSIKPPGLRERAMRSSMLSQRRGDSVKQADEASVSAGRSSANSERSGAALGTNRTPGTVVVNGTYGTKPFVVQGQGLKSNAPTEKQSKKNLTRNSSPMGAIELHGLEIIDKPSLCETWLKQHYSDSSTLGSLGRSTSIETTSQTAIPSTKKPETNLIAPGNPAVASVKFGTAAGGTDDLDLTPPTPPNSEASYFSRKGKVTIQSNGEQVLPFGNSSRLMITSTADAVPLLTYKPQILSSDCVKPPHSDHVQEPCSGTSTPPTVNPPSAQVADSPSSRTAVGGKRKKAKRLRDKSVHNTKSAATSPIPQRKSFALQDSRQISLTVETFSFCSTGVNTSLSVTRLSSRSMGVQCPSRAVSKRPSATTDLLQSIIEGEAKQDNQVHTAPGMRAMLTEVATKLESQLLVQKSVATQWLRHASVPNLALKSPEKKTGKQTKRGSSNKRQGPTSAKPALGEYDLGLNELQMEMVRALHRRRMFRSFSTNSLALGTNEANAKKVMRRLFRKKRKKLKSDVAEGKSKCRNKKEKDALLAKSPAVSGSGRSSGGVGTPVSRAGDLTEGNTDRSAMSSATLCDVVSDATGGVRKNGQQSPRLLLVRGAETPQSPALFEDLEGGSPAGTSGPNWCSVHNKPVESGATQAGADGDSDEVSAAVAQVNTGARVLRVSLADEESRCADLGSVEFVVRGTEVVRRPTSTPSVLARLRQMLTWRT